MLAVKPVLLNCDTGEIRLPNEDFLIESKVTYIMTPCEYGHVAPAENHDCGIVTTLDLDVMKKIVVRESEAYDKNRLPMLAVFQVLGTTFADPDAHTLRSRGLFYFGYIKSKSLPYYLYRAHANEYLGYTFESVSEFFTYLRSCGFNRTKFTGFFRGYTGE